MKRLLTLAGCMCLSAVLATAQTTATSPGQDMKTTPQTPATDPNAIGTSTQEDMRTGTAVSGQSSVGSQSSTSAQGTSGKEVKLEGCIKEHSGHYMLHSKKFKDGIAIVSSQDLSAHVGHEVRISGTWTTAAPRASSQGMTHSAPHSAAHGTTSSTTTGTTSSTGSSTSSTYPSTSSTTTPGTTSSSTPGATGTTSTSGTASTTGSTSPTSPDTSGTSASTGSSTTPGTSSTSTPSSTPGSSADTSMQKPESDQSSAASSSVRAVQVRNIEMVSASCKMKDKSNPSSTPR